MLFFLLDDKSEVIEREVYTIADAFAATGGFLEIIVIAVSFLIGGI